MALKGVYVAMVTMALLFGNHNCIVETVRSVGKPLLQTLSLTVKPLNESHTEYVCLFQGPTDTEVLFKHKPVDAYLVSDHVFEALIVVDNYDILRMITVKSNSTREQIEIKPNFNSNPRTQENFTENSCDVGIDKVMRDNSTEFTATVRNCGNKNKPSVSFFAHVSFQSDEPYMAESLDLNVPGPVYESVFIDLFYAYTNSDEDGIYHAGWDFPKFKAYGYTFQRFGFAIGFSNDDQMFEDDTATLTRKWFFEIMNGFE